MIQWYGAGGDWINEGLLHYVAIDRKPENGCVIQTRGKTGIMMELHVVKWPAEEHLSLENDDEDLGHGCKIMLHLLCYWSSAKCHIVPANSYYASVQAACRLFDLNFRFIGVIKTATKLFPKAYLGKMELPIRGTMAALTAVHDGVQLLAFVYCDHDHHYFISTCSNFAGGDPIRRTRLRHLQPIETDEPPEQVEIKLNCPQAASLYYSACGRPAQSMLTKWIGFGEEDSDQVVAQEGQFVDFWDDCGGLVPTPSGVHWWTLQPALVLSDVD
jgi:hypothetical protein